MKKEIKFLEPAEAEFLNAINYYNTQSSGLGYEFAVEIYKSIERIISFPKSWPKLSKRTRKCRCNRFPYNIIYFLENSSVIIIAIMHSKRKPEYWKERLK